MLKFKAILADAKISSKLLLLAASFLFFALMGMILWRIFSNGDPSDISSLKTLQILTQIGAFLVPAIFVSYLFAKNQNEYLHYLQAPKLISIGAIIVLMILMIPFINLLGDLNKHLILPDFLSQVEKWISDTEAEAAKTTELLLNINNYEGLLLNLFVIAILPAISEELFFRGALQSIISEKKNYQTAIWLTAFIFSAIHFQFYGFIPRLLVGAFFGYLLFWSGNIWLPIAAHFTNNSISVLYYYFKNIGYNTPEIDTIGTGNTIWVGCLSGIVAIAGLFLFRKKFLKN